MNRAVSRIRSLSLRPALLVLSLLFAFALVSPALAQGEAPPAAEDADSGLKPGQWVTYEQQVPINVVFVGYDKNMIDVGEFKATLPGGYNPIVRYPAVFGVAGRDLGLSFNFKYNVVFANDSFNDDYFAYLASIATPGDLALPQIWYNDNATNVLDVTGPVGYIDAPSAEAWLLNNAYRLDIQTDKAYTVFYVNWYGRDDFQFHVYTKTDDPDPDTGYNFGELRESRKIIAWGGSHGRAWFYDLSAGPEMWTNNWLVDSTDVDGNGVEDYRNPPIWEYASNGYRDPGELSFDLGWETRLVAINLLFTPSPLYDPMVSAPGPSGKKVANMEVFEFDRSPRFSGIDYVDTDFISQETTALQPYYDWQFVVDNNQWVPQGARDALRIAGNVLIKDDCWNAIGTTAAQLFCYFDQNYDDYVPAYGPQDSVSASFLYNTTSNRLGSLNGVLGFADYNYTDGTPSFVFGFLTRQYKSLGYGLAATTVHELGHYHGLSHPHDGYDSEWDIDYSPFDGAYFAWAGDESATIMSYLDLNNSFGTFNHDSMGRYQFAGYLNWSNALLDDIQGHPNYNSVKPLVDDGKALAKQAEAAFKAWRYDDAAMYARQSFEAIGTAAEQLGIPTSRASALRLTPNPNVPRQVDPIRHPDN